MTAPKATEPKEWHEDEKMTALCEAPEMPESTDEDTEEMQPADMAGDPVNVDEWGEEIL